MAILRSVVCAALLAGIVYWLTDHVRWRRALDAELGVEQESMLSET